MKIRLGDITKKVPFLDEMRTSFLSSVCTVGITCWEKTFRIERVISEPARAHLDQGLPAILSIYHGRIIGMLDVFKPRHKITILISLSRDGEFLARTVRGLGYRTARGSPAHKAVEGALQLVAAAKEGQHLTIAVDGPRGPIYKVKTGVIRIAELSGLPIIPFVCYGKNSHFFKGWDKMMGCYLGSPMVHALGDPIFVPDNLDEDGREEYRLKLEEAMDKLRAFTDSYFEN